MEPFFAVPTAFSTRPSVSRSAPLFGVSPRRGGCLLAIYALWLAPGICTADHLPVDVTLGIDQGGNRIMEYAAKSGPYEITMTLPVPGAGKPVDVRIYVRNATSGEAYEGPLFLRLLAHSPIWGDREVVPGRTLAPRDGLYYARFSFPAEGSYMAELTIGRAPSREERILLPVVIGDQGKPLLLLGSIAAGLALFVGAIVVVKRIAG